jgi:hypothetical protein
VELARLRAAYDAPLNPPNKLWVWEGVLADYADGMVCVLAPDEKSARELIAAKDPVAAQYLPSAPKCVEAPEAFIVWCGG